MKVHDEANEKGIMWFAVNGSETRLVSCLQNAKNLCQRRQNIRKYLKRALYYPALNELQKKNQKTFALTCPPFRSCTCQESGNMKEASPQTHHPWTQSARPSLIWKALQSTRQPHTGRVSTVNISHTAPISLQHRNIYWATNYTCST